MATSMYSSQPGAHYGYPQPPPSPPIDESSRCSLPSISNLLVVADAGSPTTEQSPASQQQTQQASSTKSETRPNSSHYGNNGSSRTAMPPTPPMSTDASFEGHGSPSTRSVSQVSIVSAPNYYYESTPPLETDLQRHHMQTAAIPRVPVQAPAYPQQPYATPSYMGQPALSYYQPAVQAPGQPQISGLYYQRPLPQVLLPPLTRSLCNIETNFRQAFPPLAVTVPLPPSSGPNPWQHHHYISPSSAASFPQSQDRYICQTCNKAFSRPSSLRIHSHSHTGEKPFKCPHSGCGKAFSVRSNMKRHERGCHNFEASSSALR
ncbi:putative C2H2-type domain-containing protein [Seiridium unicorne]|uniref:C2H2-type domain-containing protein n=1 Tax=Seiridium unicorne TaxID=138068 RepID=A0ABR2URX0_9PEZI